MGTRKEVHQNSVSLYSGSWVLNKKHMAYSQGLMLPLEESKHLFTIKKPTFVVEYSF